MFSSNKVFQSSEFKKYLVCLGRKKNYVTYFSLIALNLSCEQSHVFPSYILQDEKKS